MSIMNSMKSSKLYKGFSARIMILLLVAAGSSITLMIGSITGVGILAAFHHIIGIYHQQTVEASAFLVTSEIEQLLHKSLQPVSERWAADVLRISDLSCSKVAAEAWHWNFTDRQLTFMNASGSSLIPLNESGIPFLQIAAGNFAANFQSESATLPKLPAHVRWTINRQPTGDTSSWLVWAVAVDASSSDVWGFRVTQDNLRLQLIRMLRRLCHDNHMQISLIDENDRLVMSVNYQGAINSSRPAIAGKNEMFLERRLGQSLEGLKIQIVYVPGIFGVVPDWFYTVAFSVIALLGSLLCGTLVYFYGLERVSTNKLELQNDWVLNLAHSLRGPCHSLGVLTEAMKSAGDNEELHSLARRELEIMDSHCRQFLQLARKDLSAAGARIETINLVPIIKRSIERAMVRFPNFDKNAIELGALSDISVRGNSEAAEEMILTVIDNAIKYSRGKGKIQISGAAFENMFKIKICDHGVGISAEDLPSIGTAFYRSNRSGLDGINGTGIGLYLARQACDTMGWKMKIESEGPDRGTTVTFEIPVAAR
ncbi:MAG: HAMP domain-containing sensor histidine kinase [Candidatus Riflebacteria bacterium]